MQRQKQEMRRQQQELQQFAKELQRHAKELHLQSKNTTHSTVQVGRFQLDAIFVIAGLSFNKISLAPRP